MTYKNSSIEIVPCLKSSNPRFKDIEGMRFNRLLVTKLIGRGGQRFYWECVCDCGELILADGKNLRVGHTTSCGCWNNDQNRLANTTHGKTGTPEYRTWQAMKRRCLTPQCADFGNYGGRGITICDRWAVSFDTFLADMGERPSPKHSIDRIDNSQGYSPENCRWATSKQQNRNRRDNALITFQKDTLCLAEWAERKGMRDVTLDRRLRKYGWSVERALTTPVRPQRKRKQL